MVLVNAFKVNFAWMLLTLLCFVLDVFYMNFVMSLCLCEGFWILNLIYYSLYLDQFSQCNELV